jgi:hypothetical protein
MAQDFETEVDKVCKVDDMIRRTAPLSTINKMSLILQSGEKDKLSTAEVAREATNIDVLLHTVDLCDFLLAEAICLPDTS